MDCPPAHRAKVLDTPTTVLDAPGNELDTPESVLDTPGRVFETPGGVLDTPTTVLDAPRNELDLRVVGREGNPTMVRLQGYLAHKKQPPPRTLQQPYA